MNDLKIAVIGLGYVGFPLAVKLSQHYSQVIGLDISQSRIDEIRRGYDRTHDVNAEDMVDLKLHVTTDIHELIECTIFIVAVPTPVDEENQPDFKLLIDASINIASILKRGDIIVYESTVYPGITEDLCGKILSDTSGLICGQDFHLGYSPERINPGDREHTLETCTKVVAGQTPEITDILAEMYGRVTRNNVFKAASIKVAEAAKVIENAQRDVNIAFINEIAVIFSRLNISIHDVLEAAKTKWNFLNFQPGLVGGHCIGVDPFYLAECSMKLGHVPKVILAGREMNDQMAHILAARIEKRLLSCMDQKKSPKKLRLLFLGLTFKENVPDLRNSKVIDMIRYFQQRGYNIDVHDPCADKNEAQHYYELNLLTDVELGNNQGHYDGVIAAVSHNYYLQQNINFLQQLLQPYGLLADIKGTWRHQVDDSINYWTL